MQVFSAPPPDLCLESGQIHVWRAFDSQDEKQISTLRATLSPDEQKKAAAFRFDRDRNRFIRWRGILRQLLGKYLKRSALQIQFSYGPHGKPDLPQAPLHFNVSHTDGAALFAFASDQPVGVDIERIKTGPEFASIARQFLSQDESQAIAASDGIAQAELFYTCWTRKEARLKLLGSGLGSEELDAAASPAWITKLDVAPTFAAALATIDRPKAVHLWLFE